MKSLLCHKTFVSLVLWVGVSLQPAMAQTARTPSPEGATVRISNIEDKATLPATFLVKFEVTGMEVAPAGDKTPNSGHHHLFIDLEALVGIDKPLPATDKIIHFGAGQTEAEITLPPGNHTLQLMFADANHVAFNPIVMSKQIDITVVEKVEEPAKQ